MTPEERPHALLGASSAARWLACPGSVAITKDLPDTTSEYAAEGTLAHEIAELKLRKRLMTGIGKKTFDKRMAEFKANPLYQQEMEGTTDAYVDYIEELFIGYPSKPHIAIEKKVDFSDFAPEGFGTVDCVLIGGGVMHIIDYKHGKGVAVDAEENPQLKLYALGAIMMYRQFYNIDAIQLHIVQPRIGAPKSWTLQRDDLINWGVYIVRPQAKKAYEGCEEYATGDWCKFCKVKASCKTRAAQYLSLEPYVPQLPNTLPPQQIAQILPRTAGLVAWVKDLTDYALQVVLDGGEIPGFKAVEGRSNRTFTDITAAFAALQAAGIEEALLYERKPLTLSAAEKLVGPKRFNEVASSFVVKPPGAPTLVPESDKRPPYSSAAQDFANPT